MSTQGIPSLEEFNSTIHRGLAKLIGIRLTELGPDRVTAVMPVDDNTRQPYGLLHGGASAALAETVASIGALMNVDRDTQAAVGVELNANHLRSKTEGEVTATATPLHRGRTIQVWEIRIEDEDARLVCVSRCTLAVVSRRGGPPQ
ncbi:MAG TPA: hotdog fold thioesterase [Gemmatimonadaceae bacterium]|nr:hotdog fold thioesterase [Gemmatimonadaceae bacterium]